MLIQVAINNIESTEQGEEILKKWHYHLDEDQSHVVVERDVDGVVVRISGFHPWADEIEEDGEECSCGDDCCKEGHEHSEGDCCKEGHEHSEGDCCKEGHEHSEGDCCKESHEHAEGDCCKEGHEHAEGDCCKESHEHAEGECCKDGHEHAEEKSCCCQGGDDAAHGEDEDDESDDEGEESEVIYLGQALFMPAEDQAHVLADELMDDNYIGTVSVSMAGVELTDTDAFRALPADTKSAVIAAIEELGDAEAYLSMYEVMGLKD